MFFFENMVKIENDKQDKFNKLGLRNRKNTSQRTYNCGGYAFNTYTWYQLMEDDEYYDFGSRWLSNEEICQKTQECIDYMLNDFEDLRVIKSLKELKKNEYAVAFRISGTQGNDFHFIKRHSNGKWSHKRGQCMIEPVLKEEVFAEDWRFKGSLYQGNLILFAKST